MASRGIEVKTRGELQAMRAAGLVLARALAAMRDAVAPGLSTFDIDAVGAQVIADAGAKSNFLGYHGFPATICASVNDEIVHGIPSPSRILRDGDLLSIDCGCVLDGWHSDAAISVHVGEPPSMAEVDLIEAANDAMWAGIAVARGNVKLGVITAAIEDSVRSSGANDGRRYGEVAGYGGHGIGTKMHMDPFVPNHGRQGKNLRLPTGTALAIEPMLTLGSHASRELGDGWTVVSKDGSRAAHVEHSVALLDGGVCVLSAVDSGAAALARYGVTPISLD